MSATVSRTFSTRILPCAFALFTLPILSGCGGGGGPSAGGVGTAAPASVSAWSGTKQLGSTTDEVITGTATDAQQNVYLAGYSTGSFDGNVNAGDSDVFVVKYDQHGNKQWTRYLGTTSYEFSTGAAVDGTGNVYVTGYTRGGLSGNSNTGGYDAFLVKYDSSGNLQWTRQFGTSSDDRGQAVALDASGNVYITGYTLGGLDGNTSSGSYDAFLRKYDASGTKQWTVQLGSTGNEFALKAAVGPNGGIYITGWTDGVVDTASAGGKDLFVAKYDDSGTSQWIVQSGTSGDDLANGIAVDSNDNAFITGFTDGNFGGTSAGGRDTFVTKLASTGATVWIQQLGSNGNDNGAGVAIDGNNNVYIVGYSDGSVDGQSNSGGDDLFLVKYDNAGSKQWSREFGSSSGDVAGGVAVGTNGIYVAGYTYGALGSNSNADPSTYTSDAIVAKYDFDGTLQ